MVNHLGLTQPPEPLSGGSSTLPDTGGLHTKSVTKQHDTLSDGGTRRWTSKNRNIYYGEAMDLNTPAVVGGVLDEARQWTRACQLMTEINHVDQRLCGAERQAELG